MTNKYSLSIIIPAYNSEKIINDCLNKILEESKKIKSEIIVVDDKSTDKTTKIVKKIKKIKLIKLKKNRGVGNARNIGADNAKYKNLCFIDSDIIISKNSIYNLLKRFHKNKNTGSVSGTQNTYNLNKDNWTSNFVCLKSCYGTESIKVEKNFSSISSEFCIISKKLFNNVGKWKSLYGAGGEEFDLGYKIRKLNKKNIKLKSAGYSGFWCDLKERSIRIISRTEKYIPILLKKKNFDSKGTFATSGQAFSAFLTLLILFLLISNLFLNFNYVILGIFILLIIQLILEINFLIYAYKKYKIKMLLFSLFGIQVINLSIILGGFLFLIKNTFGLFFNYPNK
jgi:glycosyltransferase involved in cell wall biosynthesis